MIDIKYTLKIIYFVYQPIVNANAFKDMERTNKNFDKVFINPLWTRHKIDIIHLNNKFSLILPWPEYKK